MQAKLVSATRTEKGKKLVYTGTFEDGSTKVIRTSGSHNVYNAVAQIVYTYERDGTVSEDFVFASYGAPKVHPVYRKWVVATVQITVPQATVALPEGRDECGRTPDAFLTSGTPDGEYI